MPRFTFFVTVSLLLAQRIHSECPPDTSVSPCTCSGDTSIDISCVGVISAKRLTTVLGRVLCGQRLSKFELRESKLNDIPDGLFAKVYVEDIQISFTKINSLTPASDFYGQESMLKSLSLRHCNLGIDHPWQELGSLWALIYLDLSYNNLTIVNRFQKPPPALRSLILKANKIRSIEKGAFDKLHALIELDLSENFITTMERSMFPVINNQLIFLRISDNGIIDLPEDFFDEMYGLKILYMDGNAMETLPRKVWSPIWGDLEHLDLSGNPFKCDCDYLWLSEMASPLRLYGQCGEKKLRNMTAADFKNCTFTKSINNPETIT